MATVLRHAARRFGTRAAAEAEAIIERSPMYTSTRIVNSTTGHDLTPDQKKAAVSHLALIQATKEDLHDMITAWDANYSAPGYFAYGSIVPRKNKRLLKELSQHVSPRRDDPRWRSCRRAMYFNDFLKFAGAVLMGKMVGDALSWYEGKQDHDHRGIKLFASP